eukprot:5728910-Heterocapsa_arctica.AAC.1
MDDIPYGWIDSSLVPGRRRARPCISPSAGLAIRLRRLVIRVRRLVNWRLFVVQKCMNMYRNV